MKAFTSIKQSKKLADILPLESADMEYMFLKRDGSKVSNVPFVKDDDEPEWPDGGSYDFIPCWSLAALLNSAKYNTINLHYNDVRNDWIASCTMEHSTRYESGRALNPVDACYEMILKLHEQKLL